MNKDLEGLFSPRSIAVIGASRTTGKVGAIVFNNIIESGFKGKIYPVNPNLDEVNGQKCYANVAMLPETPDLAIVAIPAVGVLGLMEEIGQKGIKNAVIFSAGFKETGDEGKRLEDQLITCAEKYKINILGPNCMGYVNNDLPINATFGQVVKQSGNLRIITQSGALAASLFDWCEATGLGFKDLVTLGNKAVLSENEVLAYWQKEGGEKVTPIGLYLESVSNGEEFIRLAGELTKKHPIFVLKPGKSKAAAVAMKSHTGSIAGEDTVLEEALEEAGVIRCQELQEFFDLARAFAWVKAPMGPRVAVISNAGGPAVLTTDTISNLGLELAEFRQETKNKLVECLPRTASFLNPVDVLGDALADRFGQALEIVMGEENVDALMLILTPQLMTQIEKTAELIGNMAARYEKPIFCSFIGGGQTALGEKVLNKYKIPAFSFPERAVKTIASMYQWRKWQNNKTEEMSDQKNEDINVEAIKNILNGAKEKKQVALDNFEANELINYAGIKVPESGEVATVEAALDFGKKFGYPVVLKLASPELLHKSDAGGVILGIKDDEGLKEAWENLASKGMKIQIQQQVNNGIEVIVGVKRDPSFGWVMLFGAGGKLAELLSDRNLHLLPINQTKAKALVARSKINKILMGFRGEAAYPLEGLYNIMQKLALVAEKCPEITEMEINPVKVTHEGVWALDAKVLIKGEEKTIDPKFKTAVVVYHKILAGKFHHLVMEMTEKMIYKAGQFISVRVAPDKMNAYSIAGKVGDKQFELLVDVSPGGKGSKYFESLKEGETINFLGPLGNFVLRDNDGSESLLFVGTGSGCSPLKCMVEAALKENKITKPIYYYFGLRYQNDIFWQDYFEKLTKEYPNFHYKLVLSKPDEGWQGLRGHVTDFIKSDFVNVANTSAYICGNNMMTEEVGKILLEKGCLENRIYRENY